MGPGFDPERDIIDFSDSESEDEINSSETDQDEDLNVDDVMKYIVTGKSQNKSTNKLVARFDRMQNV